MVMETIRWDDLSPGRCEHLQVPSLPSGSVSVSVLDAPAHLVPARPFAALLVPRGQEQDWMFCTANGLWELLFSSSVLRLVILRRSTDLLPTPEEGSHEKLSIRFADVNLHQQNTVASFSRGVSQAKSFFYVDLNSADDDDDDSVKKGFAPLLSSLFPWSHCHLGPTPDPYVVYEDNVLERRIVDIRHSEALGSGILVEDVELTCSTRNSAETANQKPKHQLRRRMRFQQTPYLIQTEILATIQKDGHDDPRYGLQDIKLWQQTSHVEDKLGLVAGSRPNGEVARTVFDVQPDHSELVQVYLPPIVAGLVLASPCLQSCIESKARARVLTIGLGGGALPVFLHNQLGFSVIAIDTEKTVVELARRFFGFVENEHLQAQVNDGIEVVYNLAHQACRSGLVSTDLAKEWQAVSEELDLETLAICSSDDPRMHVIVVDVGVSDASSGLLSPPISFLTKKFLLAVLLSLHEGGMLVINVMPRSQHDLIIVEEYLRKVFSGIYGIQVDDNYILFALCSKVEDINMSCSFARLVAGAVGEEMFDCLVEHVAPTMAGHDVVEVDMLQVLVPDEKYLIRNTRFED